LFSIVELKMRFKSTIIKDSEDHFVVCIGWTGNDEIVIGRFEKD